MRSRTRVLPRIEARGRTNYVASARPAVSGSLLDTRFVRAKSPRSRQYVLRCPTVLLQEASAAGFARVKALRAVRTRRLASRVVRLTTRSTRRAVYLSPKQPLLASSDTPLVAARYQNNLRREFARLRAIQSAAPLPTTKNIPHVDRPVPPAAVPVLDRRRTFRERLAHFNARSLARSVLMERPLLRERTAAVRSGAIKYRTPAVLQKNALAMRPRLATMQRG